MEEGAVGRYLYHASLLVTVLVGLLTFSAILLKWRRERDRRKALKKHKEMFNSWLSRHGITAFEENDNSFYVNLLNQSIKNESNEWSVRFSKLSASPNSITASINSLTQGDSHMDVWVDLCTRRGNFIELQVDSDHPSHGHVGCSLLIQTAVIKLKAFFTKHNDSLFLTTKQLFPVEVDFQITKKHPTNVAAEGIESLRQCLGHLLASLSLCQVCLQPTNNTVESHSHQLPSQDDQSNQPTRPNTLTNVLQNGDHTLNEDHTPSADHTPSKDHTPVDSGITISVQPSTPPRTMGSKAVESVDSGNAEDDEGDKNSESERHIRSRTPSPATPVSPWRRTRSYENIDELIDVTPPSPVNATPTRTFQHSNSVVDGTRSPGSLPFPNPNRLKRPISSVFPAGSSNSLDGTVSDNESSIVSESSEDTSVTSASDVSMTVYEVKEGGTIKHIVVEKSKTYKRPLHSHKLHLYNGHTFAATHFKRFRNSVGPLTCSSCKKRIHGIVGKQAYQCRDCKMIVHKGCHGLVTVTCPKSSTESMMLIYQGTPDPEY